MNKMIEKILGGINPKGINVDFGPENCEDDPEKLWDKVLLNDNDERAVILKKVLTDGVNALSKYARMKTIPKNLSGYVSVYLVDTEVYGGPPSDCLEIQIETKVPDSCKDKAIAEVRTKMTDVLTIVRNAHLNYFGRKRLDFKPADVRLISNEDDDGRDPTLLLCIFFRCNYILDSKFIPSKGLLTDSSSPTVVAPKYEETYSKLLKLTPKQLKHLNAIIDDILG